MAYTLDYSLGLGVSKAGLTDLRAQLVDTSGADVGSAVSTGFTEIGSGYYLWHYTAFPDGHRGGVKFYSNAASATILAFIAINPEESENASTNADKLLGRNLAGGSDGGRTVRDALRALRNRISRPDGNGIGTVYAEDDSTPAWTFQMTVSSSAIPVAEIDPV